VYLRKPQQLEGKDKLGIIPYVLFTTFHEVKRCMEILAGKDPQSRPIFTVVTCDVKQQIRASRWAGGQSEPIYVYDDMHCSFALVRGICGLANDFLVQNTMSNPPSPGYANARSQFNVYHISDKAEVSPVKPLELTIQNTDECCSLQVDIFSETGELNDQDVAPKKIGSIVMDAGSQRQLLDSRIAPTVNKTSFAVSPFPGKDGTAKSEASVVNGESSDGNTELDDDYDNCFNIQSGTMQALLEQQNREILLAVQQRRVELGNVINEGMQEPPSNSSMNDSLSRDSTETSTYSKMSDSLFGDSTDTLQELIKFYLDNKDATAKDAVV